jgi:membrane protein DedA with SNARE-associated domain
VSREAHVAERYRTALLCLTVVRSTLALAAFPLAPFLYRKHYLILVVLRPTRLVLFFGGVLAKHHRTDPLVIAAAALPLGLFGVWQAYALGLTHESRISSGRIPGPWKRFLPARRIRRLQRALREQGAKLIILGRLGMFPNYLLGTAAGSSDMDAKKFFISDGVGVVLEIALSMGLGYLAGSGGGKAWIIGAGVVAAVSGGVLYTYQFHRESGH